MFRSTYSDTVDLRDVGTYQTEQTALWLDRTLAFRDSDAARSGTARFVDLDYRSLIADPLAAVRRIYDAAELELTPDIVESFAHHRATNPQHARGAHRYTPEQFGLDRVTDPTAQWFYYNLFYGAQALYLSGDERRIERDWPRIREAVLRRQRTDGSFAKSGPENDPGGVEYSTAIACLTLLVPMETLPIFQRR